MTPKAFIWFFSAAVCVTFVVCFPNGPPAEVSTCVRMIPGSSSPHRLQEGNGTYFLTVDDIGNSLNGYFNFTPGALYTGSIRSDGGQTIAGFLVQAVDTSGRKIGSFGTDQRQRHLACSSAPGVANIPDAATLVHAQKHTGVSVSFSWTAPTTGRMVDFRFTIVRQSDMYFGPLSAARPNGLIPEEERPPLPATVSMPIREPADYRITARNPPGCSVSDCSVFAAVDTNEGDSNFLDIYLEGSASGWVAVGFTDTPSMFAADVIACNLQGNSEVDALDAWNPIAARDNNQNEINNAYLRTGSFVNGRLRCIISRQIDPNNDPISDIPLNTSLYLLYGFSNNQARGALLTHGLGVRDTPQVSPSRVNPQTGSASFSADRVRPALTRLHGILMWLSWPVIGLTGMFFAFFMRPSLPNGEWFQVHRALMILSLFVGAFGFFIIFVAQYRRQPNPGLINFNTGSHTAHYILGIITMLIHIVNPLIAICRCKPGAENRWIFNAIHGYGLGIGSISISLTTVGLGSAIFNIEVSPLGPSFNIFWVYVVYLILYTVVVSFGYNIIFWVVTPKIFDDKCCPDKSPSNDQEMKEKAAQPDSSADEKPPRKEPSQDSKYRWVAFSFFALFNVLFGIAMIVLIAI